MIKQIDYSTLGAFAVELLDVSPQADPRMVKILTDSLKDAIITNGSIHCPALTTYLRQQALLTDYMISENAEHVSIPLFAFLYAAAHRLDTFKNLRNYRSYQEVIVWDDQVQHTLKEWIELASHALQLIELKIPWSEYTDGFTAKSWTEIHLLSSLLPFSAASVDDCLQWLSIVVKRHKKNHALHSIGSRLTDWIKMNPSVASALETTLVNLTKDQDLVVFLGAFLFGLKKVQKHPWVYYQALVIPLLDQHHRHSVLYGLGIIAREDLHDTDLFYGMLIDMKQADQLSLQEFITLCTHLKIYRSDLFETIDSIITETQELTLIVAIIDLLFLDGEKQIDKNWAKHTMRSLMLKPGDAVKEPLDMLLLDFVEEDLATAYEFFELRIQALSHMYMTEQSLAEMVRKDPALFQTKMVQWFIQENAYVHSALRSICSQRDLDGKFFHLPAHAFEGVTDQDKVYMAYKIAGYIYSKEPLQALMLSLIKSIDVTGEIVRAALYHIMSEYIIYNYRTTLDMMKSELANNQVLSPFAKMMFVQLIQDFEAYFKLLDAITAKKELTPSREHRLLKSFHVRKQMESVRNIAEKQSFLSIVKSTKINANKWAIRRPGQPKHDISELGHFSMSVEFPSGENLDPIQQEYMRKVYQNLKKDEIHFE